MRGRAEEQATRVRTPARPRDTTGNLQAVQDGRVEKYNMAMRQSSLYWGALKTEILADLLDLEEAYEDIIEYAIQQALEKLDQEMGCIMTLVAAFYQPVPLVRENNQYVLFVGHVLAKPLPGEHPKKWPRRQYTVE